MGPPAPLFPLQSAWTAALADHVVPPLAADSRRVYVATRDGAVTALDQRTGAVAWRVEGLGGAPAAADRRVVVRNPDGTVFSLRPRDGQLRWRTETGVVGELPATLDGDRVYVTGERLVALDSESGQPVWTHSAPDPLTSPPVATVSRLLVGDAGGNLRCLDRATGVALWTQPTGGRVLAPAVVDERRGRVYLGTTDQAILEIALDRGAPGWRWKVGADVQAAGLLLPDRVVFAAFDAVLWALHRGGNLAWRAPLPSRPLGPPQLLRDYVAVACHESDVLAFSTGNGSPAGSLRTTAEIRTPLLVAGSRIVLGLRDRSVVAYDFSKDGRPERPPDVPEPPPADEADEAPLEDGVEGR